MPIVDQLPPGTVVAVAPFVDTSGTAASHLHEARGLTFIPDAAHLEATSAFLEGAWSIDAVRFVDGERTRRLHGKAYWSPDGGWALVGSPNLTAPALLKTYEAGNLEAAVLFMDRIVGLPPYEVVDLDQLQLSAPQRLADRAEEEEPTVTYFRSHVEDGVLFVEGLSTGTPVEAATHVGWRLLGEAIDGQVSITEDDHPLTRLRAPMPNNRTGLSLVHYVHQLRARRTRQAIGRAAEVIDRPPLDIQGVEELRRVLLDLYALDDLVKEERQRTHTTTVSTDDEDIGSWRPARSGDAPRIPDLYERSWQAAPDALLALVRHALRLDVGETFEERLDEYGDPSTADEEGAEEWVERSQRTTKKVLDRYRSAILDLLGRAADRIRVAADSTVADLTFLAVLRFHEKLSSTVVVIPAAAGDAEIEVPLIEHRDLISQKFELLDAYRLTRDWHQLDARRALLAHVPECLAYRFLLSDQQRQRLLTMCYEVAPELLKPDVATTPLETSGLIDAPHGISLLEPFARRTELDSTEEFAQGLLEECHVSVGDGFLLIGEAQIIELHRSPAWSVLGYGARGAAEQRTKLGLWVSNQDVSSPFATHVLMWDASKRELHEAFRRRTDNHWMARTAQHVGVETVERLEDSTVTLSRLTWLSYSDAGADGPEWLPRPAPV